MQLPHLKRCFYIVMGISLLIINVYESSQLFLATGNRSRYANHFPVAEDVLIQLKSVANSINADHSSFIQQWDSLKTITKLFHDGIKHAWPPDELIEQKQTQDYGIAHPLMNNLFFRLYYGRQKELHAFEYTDYANALKRGVGLCSQNALAVADFLSKRYHFRASAMGLGGHVVTEAYDKYNRAYILDADYNVVLPFGIKYAKAHSELVKDYYAKAGYQGNQLDNIQAIYKKSLYQQYIPSNAQHMTLFFTIHSIFSLILLIGSAYLLHRGYCLPLYMKQIKS